MTTLTPLTRLVRRRATASLVTLALTVAAVTGCSATGAGTTDASSGEASATTAVGTVWDPTTVHEVSLTLDDDAVAEMLATYAATGEKEWISADLTVDGTTLRDVGVRLKGNSSLRGVDEDSDPVDLPWLIDTDQFVDGQRLEGWEAFVIRSNVTETALNEAVALDLLEEAGLASQEAVATRFSVNGGEATLRLMVQDLDTRWYEATFGTRDGTLYKAEAGGDWSYRGDEASAYEDVFDVEAGTEDYVPLTDFLQWINESSDEEFAAGLADRLDVQAFADYLAVQELIGNFDDIDGPGNNAFLRWDPDTGLMTVVAWDHNLAFGAMPGGGGRGFGDRGVTPPDGFEPPEGMTPPPEGFERPEGFEPPEGLERPEGFEPPEGLELPEGFERPDGMPGDRLAGGPGGSNVLAERFRDTPAFAALYDDALERLRGELVEDGTAADLLDAWVTVLTEEAQDLVDAGTVAAESEQIASFLEQDTETDDT